MTRQPFLLFFIIISQSQAQPSDSASAPLSLAQGLKTISRIEYDLPVYDYPFNGYSGYSFPSMHQSLVLTSDLSRGLHWTIAKIGTSDSSGGRSMRSLFLSVGMTFSELLMISFPGGYSWLHEEWHRAILTSHGISSYNGVYDFNILSNAIPVSHVTDGDLIPLKRDHPQDFIRLSEAGNEAQIELARSLRKELFFNRSDCFLDWVTLLINTFSPASYVFMCSMPYADVLTAEIEKEEGSDVSKRDILGMDFTAWVYDLYRPNEPYAARGIHPSDSGISRYIKRTRLTKNESDYLLLQGLLAWVNVFNPQMAMRNRFAASNPVTHNPLFWNVALVHHLTPFGFTIDADVMTKSGDLNLYYTLHNFCNRNNYFPGVTLGMDDLPFSLAGVKMYGSAELDSWLQPENLLFDSQKARTGYAASLELKIAVRKHVLITGSASSKSAGWKAGEVSLGKSIGATAGVSVWWP